MPSNHQDKFSFKNTQISEDTVEAEKKLNHFYNLTDYNEVKDTVIKQELITWVKCDNGLKKITVERKFEDKYSEGYKSEYFNLK